MATAKKQHGLLILHKQKLEWYLPTLTELLSYEFPQTAVRSMDVIDHNSFLLSMSEFMKQQKLPPASYALILHESVLFEKTFAGPLKANPSKPIENGKSTAQQSVKPDAPQIPRSAEASQQSAEKEPVQPTQKQSVPPAAVEEPLPPIIPSVDEQDKEIQQFIDSVPFEEVISKTSRTQTAITVIAANKDMLLTIKEALVREGSTLEGAYPLTVFEKNSYPETGLTTVAAAQLLGKAENMKSQNFFAEETKVMETPAGTVSLGMPQDSSEKKRLYLMVGVFAILIIIMVILFMRMNAENAAINATPSPTPRLSTDTVQSTTATLPTTDQAYKQRLPIQITGTTRTASEAAAVASQLRESGFSNTTESTVRSAPVSGTIRIAEGIPQDVVEEILGVVRAVDPGIVVEENNASTSGILISL